MSARYLRKCVGKQRHETKEQANQWRASLVRAGARKDQLMIYRCNQCGTYHVGHRGRRGSKKQKGQVRR